MNKLSNIQGLMIRTITGFLFLVTAQANAQLVLHIESGQLMGASGVDVGGTLYDVELRV